MKQINILVSGAGSPGIVGTIYSLKNNFENRKINIVTTDIKADVIGKYLSDKFYLIPKASDYENYLNSVLDICKKEDINVFIPQNTKELIFLSKNLDLFKVINTKVLVSDYEKIIVANDKYKLLKLCAEIGIPYPKFYLVNNFFDLEKAAIALGYPQKPVVIKPPDSNGSRGIRIIDEKKNYKELFFNEKPTNLYMKLNQLRQILGEEFNPLLVMEYLDGDEITVDIFRDENTFISIPRKREEIRGGISFQNSAINSKELVGYTKTISDELRLKYCFGFQFKKDINGTVKILECNPRVQGTMIFSTFMGANLIYFSVKSALNEKIPSFELDWNTKLIRYWGAIGINSLGKYKI